MPAVERKELRYRTLGKRSTERVGRETRKKARSGEPYMEKLWPSAQGKIKNFLGTLNPWAASTKGQGRGLWGRKKCEEETGPVAKLL